MANKKTPGTAAKHIKKLSFLIGKWHTKGKIVQGPANSSNKIRGMDSYEYIAGGCFILHTVDVFMGNKRTEVTEIIGYDKNRKMYFMQSFDNNGQVATMYATLKKTGVLKLGDDKMQSVLTAGKNGKTMVAKWELLQNSKTWKPWMEMEFSK